MSEAARERAGASLTGAHGVAIVLYHVNDRQIEERCKVEALMESALIDRAVAHETKRCTFQTLVFQAISKTQTERCLAGDDSVTAPVVLVWSEIMHGAALSFGTAGLLSEKLGHTLIHPHADGQSVSVITVCGDDVVISSHQRHTTDGDGLLADVEV